MQASLFSPPPAAAMPDHSASRHAATPIPAEHVGHRRARVSDPESSHVAAAGAERFAGSHVARILAALDSLGTGTAHEIAQRCGLTVVQVDRRRKEMEQAGQVYVLRQDGKVFLRDGFMVWARTVQ